MSVHDLTDPPIREGNVWRFASGRTLPVVSGGSDDGGAAPAPVAAPEPAPPGMGVNAPAPEPTTFDADVVINLRRENAAYRQRAQALEGLAPEDMSALDPLLGALRTGQQDQIVNWIGSQYWQLPAEVRDAIASQFQQPQAPQGYAPQAPGQRPIGSPPPDADRPLTKAEFNQMMRERDDAQYAEAERRDNVARINAEFQTINVDPRSPYAKAVAAKTMSMAVDLGRPVPISEADAALRVELGMPPRDGAAPAPGVVPPAPNGAPSAADQWGAMTPRERTVAILQNSQRNQ